MTTKERRASNILIDDEELQQIVDETERILESENKSKGSQDKLSKQSKDQLDNTPVEDQAFYVERKRHALNPGHFRMDPGLTKEFGDRLEQAKSEIEESIKSVEDKVRDKTEELIKDLEEEHILWLEELNAFR